MRATVVFSVLLATAAPVAADRGGELIERYQLQPVRDLVGELAALPLQEPLSPEQYGRIVALRQRNPALARVGVLDDVDRDVIAASLCTSSSEPGCIRTLTLALRCLADRCEVSLPADATRKDVIEVPPACSKYRTRKRTPALGVGLDWGTGWQRSGHPSDGGAWSLGIETRLRLGRRLGVVARVDRIAGRDEAVDEDGDGTDDRSTGSITRIAALAGPSIVLDHARLFSTRRFMRLDLLAGYLATRSQPDESGLAVGADLSYQVSAIRVGARLVQGVRGADEATTFVGYLAIAPGAAPPDPVGTDCEVESKRASRLALAFDLPLGGYAISKLGYSTPSLGFEAIWNLTRSLDAVARADMLIYTGDERDRVLHHALLAGLRVDHSRTKGRREWTGFFTTWLAGYSSEAGLTPSDTDSGPVFDASLGWGVQDDDAAAYVRVHGRIGLTAENVDYLSFFLSGGLELRLDPRRWKRRS